MIVISRTASNSFDVYHDGKMADGLTFDEMLGLIASIAVPFTLVDGQPQPSLLRWLRTPAQRTAFDAQMRDVGKRALAETDGAS